MVFGAQVVGNIRGADAATYLAGCSGAGAGWGSPSQAPDDEPSHCTCGFSAILNRRRAHRAGLFYEVTHDFNNEIKHNSY